MYDLISTVEFDSASSITEVQFGYNVCDYNLPPLIDHHFCFCNNGIIMMEVLELPGSVLDLNIVIYLYASHCVIHLSPN
jgi:hypothetical protein